MKGSCAFLLILGVFIIPQFSLAQEEFEDLPLVTGTYVLDNARVFIRPGLEISPARILIRNGMIEAVGKDVPLPPEASLIPCDSLVVYAGFISGLAHTGIPQKEETNEERNRRSAIKDPGNPPDQIAGITPGQSAADLVVQSDKSIEGMRSAGFTLAHVVPRKGMLPGKGALVLLGSSDQNPLILKEEVSSFAQLEDASGIYPNTVIGVIAKFKELYRQATLHEEHQELFAANAGITAPIASPAQKALVPVATGSLPLYFKGKSVLDLHRVLELQRELGFRLILAEAKQAWHITDIVRAKSFPILLSLDLPEDKSKKKEEAKGDKKRSDKESEAEEDEKQEADKKVEEDEETKRLKQRRQESLMKHYSQAAELEKHGIAFGFSTLELKSADFLKNLRIYIKNGLSSEMALSALTTYPATLLGLERYAGTVEKGKLANLTVLTGELGDEEAEVKFVFVNGEKFSYEPGKKKKGKALIPGDVTGKWDYKVKTEEGSQTGVLHFFVENDELKGAISSDSFDRTMFQPLEDLYINKDLLHFEMNFPDEGQPRRVIFDVGFERDSMEGSVEVREVGNYTIEASRIPE